MGVWWRKKKLDCGTGLFFSRTTIVRASPADSQLRGNPRLACPACLPRPPSRITGGLKKESGTAKSAGDCRDTHPRKKKKSPDASAMKCKRGDNPGATRGGSIRRAALLAKFSPAYRNTAARQRHSSSSSATHVMLFSYINIVVISDSNGWS